MKKYIAFTLLMLLTLISACAHKTQNEAWLTKEIKIKLPAPHFNQSYHDKQLLTFQYNNQENSIITLVEGKANQLKVIGLSTLGVRLFEIDYDGINIKTKQNIFVKQLPPAEQVLSDILLSILPAEKWQPLLPKEWTLIDNDSHRKLLNETQETIVDITYEQKTANDIYKPIKIKHSIFKYQITIKSME